MEEWLLENAKDLNLPPVKNEETIFEYLVNEQGQWEHWHNRVCPIEIILFRAWERNSVMF